MNTIRKMWSGVRLILYRMLKEFPRDIVFRARWRSSSRRKKRFENLSPPVGDFSDTIDCVLINLDHRKDRLRDSNRELRNIGISDYTRFEAIRHGLPEVGCAMSHALCLKSAIGSPVPLLICEDDIEFKAEKEVVQQIISEFLMDNRLHVLALGNVVTGKLIPISNQLGISNSIQTTSCYLVKEHAANPLYRSAAKAAQLLKAGRPYARAALDQRWKIEQQRRLFFAVPLVQIVVQRASFSDIEGRFVDYGS